MLDHDIVSMYTSIAIDKRREPVTRMSRDYKARRESPDAVPSSSSLLRCQHSSEDASHPFADLFQPDEQGSPRLHDLDLFSTHAGQRMLVTFTSRLLFNSIIDYEKKYARFHFQIDRVRQCSVSLRHSPMAIVDHGCSTGN